MHFSKHMKYPLSDKKNPDLDFSNLKAAVVKKILYIYNGFLTVEQWKIPEFWWAFDSVHRIKMLFLFLFFFFSFNQSVRTDTNVTVLMLGLCHVSEVPCLLIFPVVITK